MIKRPSWLKAEIPNQQALKDFFSLLKQWHLHTVCTSARCPNLGSCLLKGALTFMILGDVCTRNCTFCAVKKGRPLPVDLEEPYRIAWVIKKLNLKHVVVTSVSRDDLVDGGAGQFFSVVESISKLNCETKVELLIPDFNGSVEALEVVVNSGADIIGHNLETVRRLYRRIRPQGRYQRSLNLLRQIKRMDRTVYTKSGLMLGLGEDYHEVIDAMVDLRRAGCDILTMGQYLSPSDEHAHVEEYLQPHQFKRYRQVGLYLGFKYVAAAPLMRSSLGAKEMLEECMNS